MNPGIETVVLVRHAQSTANLDPQIYRAMPDFAIPLTRPDDDPRGLAAGNALSGAGFDASKTCSWSSTYLRCKQTEALVLGTAFGEAAEYLAYRESFMLREHEFGDWDGLEDAEVERIDPVRFARRKAMSDRLGRFYFRYPNGESRADVVQRVSVFIGKLHRSRYTQHVVFLHGVTQRAFRMAWFNRPVEWLEEEPNPSNASVLAIRRDERTQRWTEEYLYK